MFRSVSLISKLRGIHHFNLIKIFFSSSQKIWIIYQLKKFVHNLVVEKKPIAPFYVKEKKPFATFHVREKDIYNRQSSLVFINPNDQSLKIFVGHDMALSV